jgi:ubiquitin-protein ligase
MAEVKAEWDGALARGKIVAKPVVGVGRSLAYRYGNPGGILRRQKEEGRRPADRREARLLSELENLAASCDPSFQVWVDEADIGMWRILLSGPEGDPIFDGHWFDLSVEFDAEYPRTPPSFRFLNPPYHLNITRAGRICLDEIMEAYDDYPVPALVDEIRYLLILPRPETPAGANVSKDFQDRAAYDNSVKQSVTSDKYPNCPETICRDWTKHMARHGVSGNPEVPPQFVCPIGQKVMERPVRASSGIYYERAALMQKIRDEGIGKARCTITRKLFTDADASVIIDIEFAKRIQSWQKRIS